MGTASNSMTVKLIPLTAREKREEQARETQQAMKHGFWAKGFTIAFNNADTTSDELQGLLAESKRLSEKQAGNIRRIAELLDFDNGHIDTDF